MSFDAVWQIFAAYYIVHLALFSAVVPCFNAHAMPVPPKENDHSSYALSALLLHNVLKIHSVVVSIENLVDHSPRRQPLQVLPLLV